MKLTPLEELSRRRRAEIPWPGLYVDTFTATEVVLTGWITIDMSDPRHRTPSGKRVQRFFPAGWLDLTPGVLGIPAADLARHWDAAVP